SLFLTTRHPPPSTLFPYTTLFRSQTKPRIADLGDRILARRPDTGYQEIGELRSFFTSQEFDAFHDFVTVRTWVDTNVANPVPLRSEEHTSELQSLAYLVCRLLLEK